ncbi:alpha/beta fold hydrolase [Prescottella sp. R16]|uniref:alpha/beta fold hydrolase n=1 Tax=Prescottella sp. R16 TaxID=3064529 RepID=UPI00272E17D1|nr:alpha/beta fold hydrolase [Prescottella sp. R16]
MRSAAFPRPTILPAAESGPQVRVASVTGRPVPYSVAGSGRPVVFLHGFGLTPRTYSGAIGALAASGVRVYAPALPGFGGTDPLPPQGSGSGSGFDGYARWVGGFLDAVGLDGAVPVVGHSFGGGVALASAHALGDRVSQLVLVNAVGGGAWSPAGTVREIRQRPLWRWAASAAVDTILGGTPVSTLASITGDALRNTVRAPGSVWRIGDLARSADLRAEAGHVADRGVPTTLLWSRGDTFVPQASFESLRRALGDPHVHRVAGCHSWLIGDPGAFGRAVHAALTRSARL